MLHNKLRIMKAGSFCLNPGGRATGLLVFALLATRATLIHAEVQIIQFKAEELQDYFGYASASVGDVNGDGFPDILVGAYGNDAGGLNTGRAYLFFGGPGADNTPDLVWTGGSGRYLGMGVAGAGDVNGDGFPDVLISENAADSKVFVHFGGPNMDTTPDVILAGETSSDYFGAGSHMVAGVGDVNGDGYADVAVGATAYGTFNAGRAYVFYGGPAMDATPDLIFTAEGSDDQMGTVVAGAGDVNGDGYADVLVTAEAYKDPLYLTRPGRAYVFYGGAAPNAVPDLIFQGASDYGNFGRSAAGIGDYDGDGFDDLIVGEPNYDGVGGESGRAYVYFGGPKANDDANLVIEGESAGDYLGWVSGIGDVNHDGSADFMVSAPIYPGNGDQMGRVYVYFGGDGQDDEPDLVLTGTEKNADLQGIAGAGDFDGDGVDDFLVLIHDLSGSAGFYNLSVFSAFPYLIRSPNGGESWVAGSTSEIRWQGNMPAQVDLSLDGGATWSMLGAGEGGKHENVLTLPVPDVATEQAQVRLTHDGESASWLTSRRSKGFFRIVPPTSPVSDREEIRLTGVTSDDEFGIGVNVLGDVNGDGFDDIIVGATRAGGSAQGRAYVYFLGPNHDTVPDLTLSNGIGGSFFGRSAGPAGDFNGDGFIDILVGAEGAGGTGAAYVFYGGPGIDATPDLTFLGAAASDGFGRSASAAGDVNGDGFDDIIIGANGNDTAANSAGAAYVYYGGTAPDTTPDLTLLGEAVNNYFGIAVSGAGDFDGDGFGDLLVGAYGNTAGGSLAGRAYVYRGGPAADGAPDWVLTGNTFDYLGISVARAGDMNGDGADDIVVGTLGLGSLPGRALIYHGGTDADATPDLVLTGEAPGDHFGISVACAGDVNGDGFSDLVVGADKHDAAGDNAGAAYVFFGGPQLDPVPDRKYVGEATTSGFGAAVGSGGDGSGDGFDDVLIGAYDAGAGTAYLVDFDRYHLTTPGAGETWNVGATEDIVWAGAAAADLWLTVDGGNSFDLLRANVGGKASNAVGLIVPHQPTRFARVRVAPHDPAVTGEAVSDSLFTIEASIALLNLKAEPKDGGMLLSWQTDPGPADLAGYKLERSGPGENGWQVLASLLRESEFLDATGDATMRYRLSGINGLGQELVLGETAPSPRAALSAWPLPYRGGDLKVSFLTAGGLGGAPGTAEVAVFDIGGRRVKTLVNRDYPAGSQTTAWDGTDDRGKSVANGVYFLRVVSQAQATQLKLVVLR